jgi:hypothetical protein
VTGILVLVTGTGRSGTSTVSGALHHLGLFVPGPHLGANDTNPKGFYESRWAVQFHKRLTGAAEVHEFDARPYALDRVRESVTPELRAELVEWLGRQAADGGEGSTRTADGGVQVVVKDPRSVWAQQLWGEAAAEVGLDIRYLSMLRHPAEVIGSRTTYYARKSEDAAQRRRYETFSLSRWLNSSLLNERETRGRRRTFVPYPALLEDWRSEMTRVRDALGLTYNSDLAAGEHHPVDDFIDPDLRRVRVTWDDLDVPDDLRELCQLVWDELMRLREPGVDAADVTARLDAADDRWEAMFATATAVAHDALEESRFTGRRQGAEEVRAEVAERRRRAAARTTPAPAPVPATGATPDRLVRDVTSAELLRTLAGRVLSRARSPRARR